MNRASRPDGIMSPAGAGRGGTITVAAVTALALHAAVLFCFDFVGRGPQPRALREDAGIAVDIVPIRQTASSAEVVSPSPARTVPEIPVPLPVEPVPAEEPAVVRPKPKPAPRPPARRQELSGPPAETVTPQAAGAPSSSASSPVPLGVGYNPKPPYPELARRRGQEGTVRLLASVTADGAVEDVRVIRSSGHSLLDGAALRAVRTWRFTPARDSAGRSIPGRAVVPVEFRLQ